MTATQTRNHSPLAQTFKLAALGLVASAALFTGSPQAFGGTTEIKFLSLALNPAATGKQLTDGSVIAGKTASEIADAVVSVLNTNASKYNTAAKAALVAGEALKYGQPDDTAEEIASALQTANISVVNSDKNTFVAVAGKTAGTGKGLNVTQIPDFAVTFLALDSTTSATATTVATLAKNKPAAGAILGGQASQLADDDARFNLANAAAVDAKLKAGIQDIARYVGAAADDSAIFVEKLAAAQTKSALKIALGVASGDPTNAGAQAVALFSSATPALVLALDKGVSTYAKTVSLVSDIEEIPQIAKTLAGRIAAGPTVKITKASALLSSMVKAVLTAPAVSTVGDVKVNRQDEAAEVAAYFVGGLGNALTLVKDKNGDGVEAAKLVYGWIKASVKAYNNTKLTLLSKDVSADVAASIVLTVQNLGVGFTNIQLALKDILTGAKAAANIKAIEKNTTAAISAAIADVYANGNTSGKYEDGTDGLVAVTDPETDVHPFN